MDLAALCSGDREIGAQALLCEAAVQMDLAALHSGDREIGVRAQ